jgi:WD40 repeat protein
MLSGGDDKMFRVWDMRKLAIVQRHTVEASVRWSAVSSDGLYCAVGVGYNAATIFDLRGGTKALHNVKVPKGATIRDGAFGQDGTLFLAGGEKVEHGLTAGGVWPVPAAASNTTAKPGTLLTGHSRSVLCASMHWEANALALGAADATVSAWDMTDRVPFTNFDRPLCVLCLHPATQLFAHCRISFYLQVECWCCVLEL